MNLFFFSHLINIFEFYKKKYNILNKFRREEFESKSEQKNTDVKEQISNTLNYEQLKKAMNNAYESKDYVGFITLYLLLNLNVRNLDLVVMYLNNNDKATIQTAVKNANNIEKVRQKIVSKKTNRDVKLRTHTTKLLNMIYIKDDVAYYIRNNFKTKNKYGVIRYKIKNPDFINALKNIDENTFILKSRNGFLDNTEIPDYIRRTIIKHSDEEDVKDMKFNQTLIYKVVLNHLCNIEDSKSKCDKIASKRGHSLETQSQYYLDTSGQNNIEVQEEIVKEL